MGGPLTDVSTGFAAGSVSTGFTQATPGDMKSFRSSAERIALILVIMKAQRPEQERTILPNLLDGVFLWIRGIEAL